MGHNSRATQEFVSLLTDHQEILRSYIISQMPGSPDVRDVLQEVNIVLWEKMRDFELGTNFGAWACTIAYYTILGHRKKLKRNRFLIFNDDLSRVLAEESKDREPAMLEAKRHALQLCLAKLSPANRDLLDIRYASPKGGLDQIAADTGRSRASLRVTLARLRATLRECIRRTIAAEGGAL